MSFINFLRMLMIWIFSYPLVNKVSSNVVYDPLDVPLGTPKIRTAKLFVPSEDAATLRSAMWGLGTNEGKIIAVLTKRTFDQRLIIQETFSKTYKRNLISDLDDETSGDFRNVLRGLMKNQYDFLASELYDALNNGWRADSEALIQILCSLGSEDIRQVVLSYRNIYKTSMMDVINRKTSGNFNLLLDNLISIKRSIKPGGYLNDFSQIVKAIHVKDFLGREQISESVLVDALTKLSFNEINQLGKFYEAERGRTLEYTIIGEINHPLQEALLAILQVSQNRPKYFADCLNNALTGSVNNRVITRILVSRAELDLGSIIQEFDTPREPQALKKLLNSKTSGDFNRMVLGLV